MFYQLSPGERQRNKWRRGGQFLKQDCHVCMHGGVRGRREGKEREADSDKKNGSIQAGKSQVIQGFLS